MIIKQQNANGDVIANSNVINSQQVNVIYLI